jgi:Uma2 family endonuclease
MIMTTIEKLGVVMPASWVSGPKQGQWTYKDYASLPEDGHHYEVVNGVLYMSPAPSMGHQEIVGWIFFYLVTHVKLPGLGRVYQAPTDVELGPGDVVQPDVFVVLKPHLDRVTPSRLIGAPDLVVEVASPRTARHDLDEKLHAYARAKVPEYWIVNPDAQTVEILVWQNWGYSSLGLFAGHTMLPSQVVPDFPVSVEQFFVG